jgi:hypothetical protein
MAVAPSLPPNPDAPDRQDELVAGERVVLEVVGAVEAIDRAYLRDKLLHLARTTRVTVVRVEARLFVGPSSGGTARATGAVELEQGVVVRAVAEAQTAHGAIDGLEARLTRKLVSS